MFPIQTKLPRIAFAAIFGGLAAFPACAQSLQERMSTCFDCHGEKGQSQRPGAAGLSEALRSDAAARCAELASATYMQPAV